MPIIEMPLSEALEKGYEIIDSPVQRETDPTWLENAQLIAAEVAPSIAGGIIGSFAGPGGAAAGGGLGAGVGNLWAQNLRRDMGLSEGIGKGELMAAIGTGAIPLGSLAKAGTVTRAALRGAQGAGLANAELFARTIIDEGRAPTQEEVKNALLWGGVIGGGLGAVEAKYFKDATGADIKKGDTEELVIKKHAEKSGKSEEAAKQDVQQLQDVFYEEFDKLKPEDWKQAVGGSDLKKLGAALRSEELGDPTGLQRRSDIELQALGDQYRQQEKVTIRDLLPPAARGKYNEMQAIQQAYGERQVTAWDDINKDAEFLNELVDYSSPSATAQKNLGTQRTTPQVQAASPVQTGIELQPNLATTLKNAMTGITDDLSSDIGRLSHIQKEIAKLEAIKADKSRGFTKYHKRKLTDLRSQENDITSNLPTDNAFDGYTEQFKKIKALEKDIDQLDFAIEQAKPEQRGNIVNERNMKLKELRGARLDIPKEEQAAKDFFTSKKFQQYVASGALSAGGAAGLAQAIAGADDDDDNLYKADMSHIFGIGLLALLAGAATKGRWRGSARNVNRLEKPKIKNGKIARDSESPEMTESKVQQGLQDLEKGRYRKSAVWMDEAKKLISNAIDPLSRVLKTVGAPVAEAFKKHEFNVVNRQSDLKKRVHRFWVPMQNVLTKKGMLAEFNTATRNQDWKTIQKYMDTYHNELNAEIKKVAKKAGDKNWQSATFDSKVRDEAKDILDEIFIEAREDAAMDIGYIESYIPRLLKKGAYKQMRKYMDENGMSQEINDLDRALEEYAARMDIPVEALSDLEKVEVASRVLGTKPRGTKTGHEKTRVFEQVDDRLADFYEDTVTSVSHYIDSMVERIESRKFLGQQLSKRSEGGKVVDPGIQNIQDKLDTRFGLGTNVRIDDTLAGKLAETFGDNFGIKSQDDLRKLQYVIQKRFNGESANTIINDLKTANYFGTIANFGTTLTQLMDLVNGFWFAGAPNIMKAALNKQRRDWFNDIGLDRNNSIDFGATSGGFNKALDKVLTATGFNQLDKWSKNTSLEALYQKFRKKAKANPDKLRTELISKYGDDGKQMVDDLLSFDGSVSKNAAPKSIQSLLFSEASDFLPLSRLEMPGMATGPIAPIFYQLKTYMVKQADIYREIANGDIAKGFELMKQGKFDQAAKKAAPAMGKIAAYGGLLAAAGMPVDMVKDWMYGRPIEIDETVQNNLLRIALINRYHVYNAKREGIAKTALEYMMPATTVLDRTSKDMWAFASGEDIKGHSLQGTILDLVYWHWDEMGGYEKANR